MRLAMKNPPFSIMMYGSLPNKKTSNKHGSWLVFSA
jgi:hypothetical protein